LYTTRAINPIIEVVSTPPCGVNWKKTKRKGDKNGRQRDREWDEENIYLNVVW
jgi:hypothetical protein